MEPLLIESKKRYTIIPISPQYKDLWELYKKHFDALWKHSDIDYLKDKEQWETLSDVEKKFICMILAFFASSDGVVIENLLTTFCTEVQSPEARAFYGVQTVIETEHAITYGLLIDNLVTDATQKNYLFNAIETIPVVKKKFEWATKWIGKDHERPFSERLVAFAIVEGVFFSGAFCSIFWLKDKNKMVGTLGHSNELIARDEGLHVEFAVALFHHLINKPSQKIIHSMFREAVELEVEFITEAIPCRMIGMNSELMIDYIGFVADRLLIQLGYDIIYNNKCPFSFMDNISLDGKTNFFERRVSEYKLASDNINANSFNVDGDF